MAHTVGQLTAGLARNMLPANDPHRLAYEWMAANSGRLRQATADIGVTIEEGPDFGERLFQAIAKRLSEIGWSPE